MQIGRTECLGSVLAEEADDVVVAGGIGGRRCDREGREGEGERCGKDEAVAPHCRRGVVMGGKKGRDG